MTFYAALCYYLADWRRRARRTARAGKVAAVVALLLARSAFSRRRLD